MKSDVSDRRIALSRSSRSGAETGPDSYEENVGALLPGEPVRLPATGSGPLDGIRCGVKDAIDVANAPTGYGNPTWAATHSIPATHASVVTRLLASGAHIVGKTITDELAFSLVGNNHHYGAPINVAARDRFTGGSSCGSAAAVAANLCDIALGTDTAGSVRAPASYCGVFGFRPTHGLVPNEGVCRLAPSLDTVGWFARDARQLACVGDVLLPASLPASALSGWVSLDSAWESLDPAIVPSSGAALDDVASFLGSRARWRLDDGKSESYVNAFRTIQFYEVWRELGPWVTQAAPDLGPGVRERMQMARGVSGDEYRSATRIRTELRRYLDSLLDGTRALVLPTVSRPAPLRSSTQAELEEARRAALRLLCLASLAGLPQVTMPMFRVSGAPLGLSIMGPAGSDKSILTLAARMAAADRATSRDGVHEVRVQCPT